MKNPDQVAVARGANGTSRRRRRRWLLGGTALLALGIGGPNAHLLLASQGHVFALDAAPVADCIVVPGARILPDGRPYSMLVDRLVLARDLFAAGKAKVVVLSGKGGGGLAEDEVAAMRRWLVAHGVPAEALRDDPLGLRTIDTMRRCRDEFGMRSVLVATNGFHVARSVFLARQCGLDASGVAAAEGQNYSLGTRVKNVGREVLARAFAWCEVFVGGAAG